MNNQHRHRAMTDQAFRSRTFQPMPHLPNIPTANDDQIHRISFHSLYDHLVRLSFKYLRGHFRSRLPASLEFSLQPFLQSLARLRERLQTITFCLRLGAWRNHYP